jgi:hypothetical protein
VERLGPRIGPSYGITGLTTRTGSCRTAESVAQPLHRAAAAIIDSGCSVVTEFAAPRSSSLIRNSLAAVAASSTHI